ncbi:DUF1801 domain-containing protein [Belliella sp. DSM 111904]|uniref:DUF1801 domain-containing protein n=1 Tax=Belliella filtrata TaxID=2923435 RepID=A0ABS9V306_9BACT|nr:DUF1801 domain-containing protein [Belliella filtrata]MCH7410758.1 DUF1801 domain-containing protein [Belliella filtrata]
MINPEIQAYNNLQKKEYTEICNAISEIVGRCLPESESKIWHRHPVWFLDGNPTVGYSIQKPGVRLMFWSGADFEEDKLNILGKKFKDASIFYINVSQIDMADLERWLSKSKEIQWDYKNLVKRKGELLKLKG